MRAIPIPMRKRILELYERGRSTREIAQFAGFCIAAVRRVRQQFRERRVLEPRTYLCGRKTQLTEERKRRLHQLLAEQPDATLAELGAGLDRPFRTSTIDLWLRRLGCRFKKTLAAAEQQRPDAAEKRARWHEGLAAQPTAPLLFVDESGANTKMTRLRGRALGGPYGSQNGRQEPLRNSDWKAHCGTAVARKRVPDTFRARHLSGPPFHPGPSADGERIEARKAKRESRNAGAVHS